MKRLSLMVGALLVAMMAVAGQELDLTTVLSGELRAEGMAAVQPLSDGETYAQLSDDGSRIVKYSFKTGREAGVLFDVSTVRGPKLSAIDGYIVSPDGKRLLIQTATNRIYRHSFTAVYYIYDVANNRMEPLSDGGPQQTPLFSPDGTQIAFVRDNNIYLVKLLFDNAESQVTKDGLRGEIINGVPDWVNEEEFGGDRAMVFTADSRQLVWVRYDESQVKQYAMQMFCGQRPAFDEYAVYPGYYSYKYPVAGEDNARVTVMSYDIKSRQTRQMQLPLDADGYVSRVVMTSDPTKVAVYTLNRHQDDLRIYMANPLSTVCQQVIQDKVDKYIREECVTDIKITDRHLLMLSERDGWQHLYLYTLGGQLVRRVTQGQFEVTAVYGYDEATGDVYYAANDQGPTDRQLYVAHQNGKTERLSRQRGWNNAVAFSSNFKYHIQSWSDLNTPPVYTVNDNRGRQLAVLTDNNRLKERLQQYTLGRRELFTFKTSEGVELNGWMVKPADFDASKRYPVVMYQYGGPGNQQVTNSWNIGMMGQGALLEQYLCQQGFVCVCVDNRGTGGRGADFEKCTYLQLGQLESRDQVEAALWLGSQPYVDANRIAIWGWSFGGFNTLMSMSEGRPVFRAGVAIAPPTSWRYYDTIYTERYMRTPKENPQGYAANPITRASLLHGALLICHGSADDNVHYRNTAEYAEALVQADKDFKENIYTNRNHSIYGGNTRRHLFRQAVNFFLQELR